MARRARGTFEVDLKPESGEEVTGGTSLSRMSIRKEFRGDLQGASAGEMLAAQAPVAGSAGYVAIERVEGTLGGRSGTFVLQHSGTMEDGQQDLSVTVVPDSGTGGLEGIRGRMVIVITDGEHSYDFEYSLPEER